MKKNKIWIILGVIVFAAMIGGIGFGSAIYASSAEKNYYFVPFQVMGRAEMRNTIEIPVAEAENLMMEYGSQNIYVYPSEDDKIVIKEYLRSNREESKASVEISNGTARVRRGQQPIALFSFFSGEEKIEVYLPADQMKLIDLVSASGNITQKNGYDLSCDRLLVRASSGNINWQNAVAGEIDFSANSGNITLNHVHGTGSIRTTSGEIRVNDFEGSGSIQANSGNVNVDAGKITGDIQAQATSGNVTLAAKEAAGNVSVQANSGNVKLNVDSVAGDIYMKATSGNASASTQHFNGNIKMEANSGNVALEVPADAEFQFEANTSSGSIHTSFDDSLSYNKKGNEAKGTIGENPEFTVSMKASSGNVKVVR